MVSILTGMELEKGSFRMLKETEEYMKETGVCTIKEKIRLSLFGGGASCLWMNGTDIMYWASAMHAVPRGLALRLALRISRVYRSWKVTNCSTGSTNTSHFKGSCSRITERSSQCTAAIISIVEG